MRPEAKEKSREFYTWLNERALERGLLTKQEYDREQRRMALPEWPELDGVLKRRRGKVVLEPYPVQRQREISAVLA